MMPEDKETRDFVTDFIKERQRQEEIEKRNGVEFLYTEEELNNFGLDANWDTYTFNFNDMQLYDFVSGMSKDDIKRLREKASLQEYFILKSEVLELQSQREDLLRKIDSGVSYANGGSSPDEIYRKIPQESADVFELLYANNDLRILNLQLDQIPGEIDNLKFQIGLHGVEVTSAQRDVDRTKEAIEQITQLYFFSDTQQEIDKNGFDLETERERLALKIEILNNKLKTIDEINAKIQRVNEKESDLLEQKRVIEAKIAEIKKRQENGYIDVEKKQKDLEELEKLNSQIMPKVSRIEELMKIIRDMEKTKKRRSPGPRKPKAASNDTLASLDGNLSAETATPTNSAEEPLKVENPVMPEGSSSIEIPKEPEEPIKEDQIETGPTDDKPDKNVSDVTEPTRVDDPDKGKNSKKIERVRKVNFAWAKGFTKFVKEKVKKRLDNLSYAPKMSFSSINRQEGYDNPPPPAWAVDAMKKEEKKQIKAIKRSETWWAKGFRNKVKPAISKWWISLRDGYEIPVEEQNENLDHLFIVDSDEIDDDGIKVSLA